MLPTLVTITINSPVTVLYRLLLVTPLSPVDGSGPNYKVVESLT